MKKTLVILDFEDRTATNGRKYVRFKTSEGWMSCFDSKTYSVLKERINEKVLVSLKIDEENDFVNILKVEEGQTEKRTEKLEKPEKLEKSQFPLSMKVSYAKDLIIQKGVEVEKAIEIISALEKGFS